MGKEAGAVEICEDPEALETLGGRNTRYGEASAESPIPCNIKESDLNYNLHGSMVDAHHA